jgi:hypothetical protein
MNAKWKQVIEEKEFGGMFTSSSLFREKLSEILEKEIESLEICDDYEIANWHLKQAETNGKRKALQLVLKLIK